MTDDTRAGRESLLRAKSILESVVSAYNGNTTDRIAGPIYALEEVNSLIASALRQLGTQEVSHG